MKRFNPGKFATRFFLVIAWFVVFSEAKSQSGAILTGIVTNNLTGTPIVGARISAGSNFTYSTGNGLYVLNISPAGTYTVSCTKPGYEEFQSLPMTFQVSFTYSLNLSLDESRNPPVNVTATPDSSGTAPRINVQWEVPRGDYDLIYDDGIPENLTVWSIQGNMNAVRFTPAGYPARITGGMINIGSSSGYPSGSNPFVPFQVVIYNDSGPGGTPGTAISSPLVVIPNSFGWVNFTFSSPVQVNSGNFFIVMIQGGNAPNASGLAVDETQPQLRNYSRFVTGGGGWIPAAGNFLIRALVNGPGGPTYMKNTDLSTTGYVLYRLRQGEEMNPSVWTALGSATTRLFVDNSWLSLPCGPYRWGVQALYPGNRVSAVTFSNVIGKCWTRNITVRVTLSCEDISAAGTRVTLKNLVYPDTLYNQLTDPLGEVNFPYLWKGSYELKISRFGYETYLENLTLDYDSLFQIYLLQEKKPPSELTVNEYSLRATWNKPDPEREIFSENWESGSFSTNSWTLPGGTNWMISTAFGNPQPSAMFGWSPPAVNYDQSLISKPITGLNSPIMKLCYDIYLDSHGTTTLNQMAVELWDGTTWHQLKNYSNSSGDIHWTSQEINISAYSASTFKIRFRAYGGDSYDINNWNIDNIKVLASESQTAGEQCILGYYFYLDNVLCSFLQDTTYQIPSGLVTYGNSYSACVTAMYGSGPSTPTCKSFVSKYLDPPINLHGNGVKDTAFLFWNKPQVLKSSGVPPGLIGYRVYRDGSSIDSIDGADITSYVDPDLFPGAYLYGVSSVYDLSSYGFPGATGESVPAGPVEINIEYGMTLPFSEPWNSGGFQSNLWTFSPDQGNWQVNPDQGNPSPSAIFSGTPVMSNYSSALESAVINAAAFTCSQIWLDFDVRLSDLNQTSTEKLIIEIFNNNNWNKIGEEINDGGFGWTPRHLDISVVKGKAFKIRFRATGSGSGNITHWGLDNIFIYAICKPPRHLLADAQGLDVRLSWSPPVCADGHPMNEGFEGDQFPPEFWNRKITNQAATWFHSDQNSPIGVHSGNYAARIASDYAHQDEWLIAENVTVTGDLTFWSFAYQGSVHHDHYYVKLSRDQGLTWEILLDLSALPVYPGVSGYNQWNTPYTVGLSAYLDEVVDIAWQAVDGDGQGVWYNWAIDDCKVGTGMIKEFRMKTGSQTFDVYRSSYGSNSYQKINLFPVQDTTYLDQQLSPNVYSYYITATSENCLDHLTSDTAEVDVIIGTFEKQTESGVRIFPNPSDDKVTVETDSEIQAVEIRDFTGRIVNNFYFTEKQRIELSVWHLSPGIYLVKVITDKGFTISKWIISR